MRLSALYSLAKSSFRNPLLEMAKYSPAAEILQVEEVYKSYGANEVLRGVGFAQNRGERIALMGPSGSGKSTLLNCLGGIDRPDRGRILFEEQVLSSLSEREIAAIRRSRVGTVFQSFHLLPTLTARENIVLPLYLQGIPADQSRERVQSLLDETGIAHRADALPGELSGGEQQRVAIARALVGRPVLILADEPTGNLDSRTGHAILDLLQSVCQAHGTALVMVTHDAATIRICHRVLHMLDGRIDRDETV